MIRVARPALLRNLQIGFGLSLLILIVTSIASWSSIRNLMDSSRLVDHTDSVINELNVTLATLTDAETGQRGYLLTADTAFLRPYVGANDRAVAIIDKIQTMTMDNPVQQSNLRELRDVVAHRLNLLQEIITQKQNDNIFSLEDVRKGRGYMDQARAVILRMQGRSTGCWRRGSKRCGGSPYLPR
ncbi:CHASE3 domain-containing protein [Puia sp. P3]|uniref:CHASE3 domain-containing protein n=1 Tax=Puia sp. P3 TaxID=3423952 RepID=UPI003D663E10